MARLNIERQKEIEPTRVGLAANAIKELGFDIEVDMAKIEFIFKGEKVTHWCYSGWHTGKSIKDGRGLQNLLKQLK